MAISSYNPVLNNAYEEPIYYYGSDINGNIDYTKIAERSRPFGFDVNIVPKKREQQTIFTQGIFVTTDPNTEFINSIRKEVKEWSFVGYPKSFANQQRTARLLI